LYISIAGFATTNSDIDVVLTTPDTGEVFFNSISAEYHSQPEKLEQEFLSEGFEVTLLTKTRVPILKLVQKADGENPFDLHCDIGFNNPLGVHNTRMMRTYAMCDPRVRDMVLFVKVFFRPFPPLSRLSSPRCLTGF
jgi:terminal uridylyltransferase